MNSINISIPGRDEFEEPYVRDVTNKMSPKYKRQGSLNGYTGHYSSPPRERDEINSASQKYMIRGYTGIVLTFLSLLFTLLFTSTFHSFIY